MTSYRKSRKNRKSRRKTVRRYRGGAVQTNEEIKTDIKNSLLNKYKFDQKNQNGKFPPGKYIVRIKYLSDSPINSGNDNRPLNRNKVCHYFSLFSLLDELKTPSSRCCGEESIMFRTIDAACKDGGSCSIKAAYNVELPTKKVMIRFYSLPLSLARKHEPISEARNHSARYEQLAGDSQERWWHKFGGVNALISIDGLEDVAYNKNKEFTLDAYEVPDDVFKAVAIEEMTVTFSGAATIV